MNDTGRDDYAVFDSAEIVSALFHPRKEPKLVAWPDNVTHLSIPVAPKVNLGAVCHHADKQAPTLLFFHGNGEIAADFNEIGFYYSQQEINFMPVDYRGYGRSSGQPNVSSMMADCQVVFDFLGNWLTENGYTGKKVVMGRSLGSASALEVAATRQGAVDALIIESGFACILPLLRLMGVDPERLGLSEKIGFRHLDKIKQCLQPLLVIHAEYDHIIPFSDGQALFDACPATSKTFVKIDDADHNTIFYYGIEAYMSGVATFLETLP